MPFRLTFSVFPPIRAVQGARFSPRALRSRRRLSNFVRGPVPLCLLLGVGVGLSAAPVRAQGSSRGANYRLGPGDVLRFEVAGFPEFNQPSIAIPPDGVVNFPRLGTVRLNGRTTLDVQNQLRGLLISRARLRNPSETLNIITFRPAPSLGQVTLIGDVPRAGGFKLRSKQHLSDLLAEAGLGERLEEKSAILVRGGRRMQLDLRRAALYPASGADILLRSGDSISVRSLAAGRITVAGDVTRPGTYELHRAPRGEFEIGATPRLSDLLTKAGWQRGGTARQASGTLEASSTSTAPSTDDPIWTGTLQRAGMTFAIHPDAALRQISGPDNIGLRAGDYVSVTQVIVPPITVYVDGLVARSASYSLKPGTTVLELLTQAGGLTRSPGEIIAGVRRGAQLLPLDLNALLTSSDSGANLTLRNGDYVQLRAPETLDVLVAGQVAKPGTVQVKPGATVFEALNQAGGITGLAEDARLSVLRKDLNGSQRIMNANAVDILNAKDLSTNYVLQRGDIINVARNAAQTVFVTGEVVNTGSFTLREGEGLTQLLTRAGGTKDDALLGRVSVTRRGQVLQVDAFNAVKKGAPLPFELQDGDQVLVQKNPNIVKVLEAVSKPGPYAIPERGQLMLTDVLAQAAPVVGAKEVFLIHANADGTANAQNSQTIKLADLRSGKAHDVLLQPRDVVFVPSPKSKTSILTTLSQLSIFRLFF